MRSAFDASTNRLNQTVKYNVTGNSGILNKNLQKAHRAKAAQKREARRAISDCAGLAAKKSKTPPENPKLTILAKFGIFKKGEDKGAVDVSVVTYKLINYLLL